MDIPTVVLINIFQCLRCVWLSPRHLENYALVCHQWHFALQTIKESHRVFFDMVYQNIREWLSVNQDAHFRFVFDRYKWCYDASYYFHKYFYGSHRMITLRMEGCVRKDCKTVLRMLKKYFKKAVCHPRVYSGTETAHEFLCWFPRNTFLIDIG